MYKQLASAIVLSCACATAMASYGFEPIAALAPEAAAAHSVAVGDVTGDGRDDVVMLGGGSHPFFRNRVVLYAQTPGGFAPPVAIDYHADPNDYGAFGAGMGLADLDGDADLDIVVSRGNYPMAALTVLRNDDDGFTASSFPADDSLTVIKFTDANGDGNLDLIGKPHYGRIWIFPGDGDAGFGAGTWVPSYDYPTTFDLVDMDGDARKDLVYQLRSGIYMRRHDGSGFSATQRTLLTLGDAGYFAQMAAADLDGDNRTDLAVSFNYWPDHAIYVYPQGSDGKFRRKQPAGRGNAVNALRAGDIDSDGRQDLLMLSQSYESDLTVMLARARGFAPMAAYPAGTPSNFGLGDLNDDGRTDVVLFGNDRGVSYLLGRPTAMEGDLAVFLGLNTGAAAVRVENRGEDFNVGNFELTLHLDPRVGTTNVGALPGGCYAYTGSDGSLYATCQMPGLAPGAHHERIFPFSITASTPRNLLFGRARASLLTGSELRLDNNVATKRINIVTPAD